MEKHQIIVIIGVLFLDLIKLTMTLDKSLKFSGPWFLCLQNVLMVTY